MSNKLEGINLGFTPPPQEHDDTLFFRIIFFRKTTYKERCKNASNLDIAKQRQYKQEMCSLFLCTILVLHELGIISGTLKGIASNHFPQRYKFLRKEMVLISLMMAPNCSLQYLKRAESYYVQHILIDMTFLNFFLKGITMYKIKPGKRRKQSSCHLNIVYLQLNLTRAHLFFG